MIAVTGASGLVGLHLLRELSYSEQEVLALYHTQIPALLPGTNASLIHWKAIDILDFQQVEEAFQGVSEVYHTAAMVSYDPRDRERMQQINVEGTANVVNAALFVGIRKLVHISSIATMGDESWPRLINEKSTADEAKIKSGYAKTKQQAELEVWRGIAEGLQAIILNPSIILGEGDWSKSSTNLFKIVYHEFPFYTTGCTGWVGAVDVAKAAILAMKSTITNERFIISAENRYYYDVFTLMAKCMAKMPPRYRASRWMSELVWRWYAIRGKVFGTRVTISKETARSAYERKGYSAEKWRAQFPEFTFLPINESIDKIAKKFALKNKSK